MKRSGFLILIILALAGIVSAQKDDKLNVVDFFAGTWKIDGKETYEKWVASGGNLIGKGYKITNGIEKISETLEIRCIDGKYKYLATVPDQNEGKTVQFALTYSTEAEYTFENPDHDFPKKLVYRKLTPTDMFVQVLGEGGKGFSFKMKKIE